MLAKTAACVPLVAVSAAARSDVVLLRSNDRAEGPMAVAAPGAEPPSAARCAT